VKVVKYKERLAKAITLKKFRLVKDFIKSKDNKVTLSLPGIYNKIYLTMSRDIEDCIYCRMHLHCRGCPLSIGSTSNKITCFNRPHPFQELRKDVNVGNAQAMIDLIKNISVPEKGVR
jgi:hypothetical protein